MIHPTQFFGGRQVEKFVRRVAEKLEIGNIALTKAIAAITSELEVYRLTQLSKQEQKPVKQLTEQEREEMKKYMYAMRREIRWLCTVYRATVLSGRNSICMAVVGWVCTGTMR